MQLKIKNATFGYGGETLLENFSFEVNTADKIAIIGRNGTGKTTILKMLTQEIELHQPDNAPPVFSVIGKPVISSLKQMTFDNENLTLEEELLSCYSKIIEVKTKLDKLQSKLEKEYSDKLISTFSSLQEEFENMGGYSYLSELNKAIASFGFSEDDKHKKLCEFSGGQRTKIAFIKLILSKPDVLLLDEPTNHLDINAVNFLENYISSYKKAVVIVSHDRAFLDKTINIIYEISHKKLTKYVGNYSKYIETKNTNYELLLKKYEAQQKEIASIQEFIDRFRYKATKATQVQSRIKMLEKMEKIPAPEKPETKTFRGTIKPRIESGSEVLSVNKLKIGYSKDAVLAELDFKVQRGDRLGIIGGNGLGKSTLLETLAEKVPALSGEFKFGYHTEVGYFSQISSKSNSTKTVYEEFQNIYPHLSDGEIRSSLGAFLFSGKDVLKLMNSLSGGELVRFELAKIFEKKPNVLILDEPTNHMDIVSRETLENLLLNYLGTIIFVSHDRYFVKKIATKLLVFGEGSAKFFDGTLAEFNDPVSRQLKQEDKPVIKKPEKVEYPIDFEEKKSENEFEEMSPYLLSKEKSRLENRLKKIEENSKLLDDKLKQLESDFVNPEIASDFKKLMEIQAEIENTQISNSKLEEEWLEKNENLEKINAILNKPESEEWFLIIQKTANFINFCCFYYIFIIFYLFFAIFNQLNFASYMFYIVQRPVDWMD